MSEKVHTDKGPLPSHMCCLDVNAYSAFVNNCRGVRCAEGFRNLVCDLASGGGDFVMKNWTGPVFNKKWLYLGPQEVPRPETGCVLHKQIVEI